MGQGFERPEMIDYRGHVNRAESIMMGKLGVESKGQILENIPLKIGPYTSGTNCLQMFYGLSPVRQVILGKGLGKR
jgi:hypothetical protein